MATDSVYGSVRKSDRACALRRAGPTTDPEALQALPGFEWGSHEPVYALITLAALPVLCGTALWLYRRPEVLMRVEPWLNAGLALFLMWKLISFARAFAEVRRRALWTPAQ